MNKKNIFIYFLLALPLLLTSCLKDQEDLFEDSASARTMKYLANAKRVLTSSEYGWVLDYFPDREQSYGGYAYTLKFDESNVAVCFEQADDVTQPISTGYSLDNEDGPVLAFDTYNDYLHYFATPSPSSGAGGYQAYDGDFIFIIMDISEDENTITLKGNRSGNIMYMHKLTQSIQDYQTGMEEFKKNLVFDQAYGEIDGQAYHLGIAADDRYMTITPVVGEDEEAEEEPIEAPFCFNIDGFSFYEPITIADKEVRNFKYDENEGTFTAVEDNSVVFTALLTTSIVINNIGEEITISNNAAALEYEFNLADKFTYTPDVDWITVKAEGKNVTINVAQNTGLSRTGHITVEVNGETATITINQVPLSGMFETLELYVAYSNISEAARPYFDACKALSDSEGENIGEMCFVNIGGQYGYGLFFTSGSYGGLLGLDITPVSGTEIKFTYDGDRNYSSGNWYYNNGYKTLINYLQSTTFTLAADDEDHPTYIILTDSKDSTKSFKLITTPVANPFDN